MVAGGKMSRVYENRRPFSRNPPRRCRKSRALNLHIRSRMSLNSGRREATPWPEISYTPKNPADRPDRSKTEISELRRLCAERRRSITSEHENLQWQLIVSRPEVGSPALRTGKYVVLTVRRLWGRGRRIEHTHRWFEPTANPYVGQDRHRPVPTRGSVELWTC